MDYHVMWEIDIEADSQEEAARIALDIQRNPESAASVFTVTDEEGEMMNIDPIADENLQ